MAGQFGFASAVPLLNQVNNVLQSGSTLDQARLPRDPRPDGVGRGVICWPGGQSLPEGSENCRRRLATWLLDGSEPPTLLLPEQEGIRGIRFPVWLDKEGKRVAADCPDHDRKGPGCLAAAAGTLAACSRAALSTDPFAIGYLSALVAGLTCTADVDWRA